MSNGNEGIIQTPQSSRIGASPSDGLVSYLGHSLGKGVCIDPVSVFYSPSQLSYKLLVAEKRKSECSGLEQRSVIKCLVGEKRKSWEIYRRMCTKTYILVKNLFNSELNMSDSWKGLVECLQANARWMTQGQIISV